MRKKRKPPSKIEKQSLEDAIRIADASARFYKELCTPEGSKRFLARPQKDHDEALAALKSAQDRVANAPILAERYAERLELLLRQQKQIAFAPKINKMRRIQNQLNRLNAQIQETETS